MHFRCTTSSLPPVLVRFLGDSVDCKFPEMQTSIAFIGSAFHGKKLWSTQVRSRSNQCAAARPQLYRRVGLGSNASRTVMVEQRKAGTEPETATQAVQQLYNTYPFPPDPLTEGAPPGYNWRWHYPTAYAFCAKGRLPATMQVRILDAGCGTGCGTEYLVHLNPQAEVVAFDLSPGALAVARERLTRSVKDSVERVRLHCKSIFDLNDGEITGQFDMINCVGVIHHTPDPLKALRMLAEKLAPGGILHIFVYAEAGRWEIRRMQAAIALLQHATHSRGDYREGVALGRALFAALPDENRLKRREKERWAQDNRSDATFADMYVHPLEHDFDVPSVLALARESGLRFLGWSNPRNFDVAHLFGDHEELMHRVMQLSDADRWRLVELLDPERITHFEFFLVKDPFDDEDLTDAEIIDGIPEWSECAFGSPSELVLDRDYLPVSLSSEQVAFAQRVAADAMAAPTLAERKRTGEIMELSACSLEEIRMLIQTGLVHIRAP
jgi:SAM-dependent methyltransferase